MPFNTGLLFAVVPYDGTSGQVLFKQLNSLIANYSGGKTIAWGINGASVYAADSSDEDPLPTQIDVITDIFSLDPTAPDSDQGEVIIDIETLNGYSSSPVPPIIQTYNSIITAFITGGRMVLQVSTDGDDEPLTIQLRAFKTADFRLDETTHTLVPIYDTSIDPEPANNIDVPASEAADPDFQTTYSMELSDSGSGGDLGLVVYNDGISRSSIPLVDSSIDNHAPPNAATRNLTLTITRVGCTGESQLPIDIHVPAEVVVLLDRSGSMGADVGDGENKWTKALSAANLFSRMYGLLTPHLASLDESDSIHRISLGFFHAPSGVSIEMTDFTSATSTPDYEDSFGEESPLSPGGLTPIGEAVVEAKNLFAPSKWKQRHIVLLTDGMDNIGTPRLNDLLSAPDSSDVPRVVCNPDACDPETCDAVPITPEVGVIIHNISYTKPGDIPYVAEIEDLINCHGGIYDDTSPADAPLSGDDLKARFLNILSRILPIEISETSASFDLSDDGLNASVEDGVERVVFVSTALPGSGSLLASLDGGTTILPGTTSGESASDGFAWLIVDRPEPGTYTIHEGISAIHVPVTVPVYALYDLSLRTRFGAIPNGVGQPIKLWAEIRQHGRPIRGADIWVTKLAPGESLGEALTHFAQRGGIAKSVKRRLLDPKQIQLAQASALRRGKVDVKSVQRQLLDALEVTRNLKFQYSADSIKLQEVSPGRYEATVSAEDAQNESVYSFKFHAYGVTPKGYNFQRDHRLSVVLPPTIDVATSQTALTQVGLSDQWIATVKPMSTTGKPLGPGLVPHVGFHYLSAKDRKSKDLPALDIVDNLDGTYSTTLTKDPKKIARFGFFLGNPDADVKPIVFTENQGKVRKVRVTLDRIQVLDDKDGCLAGAGELVFDTVVAPNASASRAVRTRIPDEGVFSISSGKSVSIGKVIYQGWVEEDAKLEIVVGGTEFDWWLFLARKEKLARYQRTLPIRPGKSVMTPDDEFIDPESLSDWKVWYTVEVE